MSRLDPVRCSGHGPAKAGQKASCAEKDRIDWQVLYSLIHYCDRSGPMDISNQRDLAILKSLQLRYRKAFERGDRDATQQLFKEATYLGISLEQLNR